MSRVRYINKKTGWVSVYESTSCYDPIAKTSRPKRRYIGHEDPVTGEFVPSSGKPGRRKEPIPINDALNSSNDSSASQKTQNKKDIELQSLKAENDSLKKEVHALRSQLKALNNAADRCITALQNAKRVSE